MLFSSIVIFNYQVIIYSENIVQWYDVHVVVRIQEFHCVKTFDRTFIIFANCEIQS